MGFNFNRYDTDRMEEGEWEDYQGGQFKIARMGNPVYRDAFRRLQKQYRKKHGDEMTSEQDDELHAYALAEGVLRDWADVEAVEDGKPVSVPYTVENAATLLISDPKFVAWVANKASDLERFEAGEQQAQAKKPPKRSLTA